MSLPVGFILDGAILDLDGTMLDSMPKWLNVGVEYLESQGFTARPGLGQTIRAMSLEEAAVFFKDEYGLDRTVEEVMHGINDLMEPFYANRADAKTGTVEFLEACHAAGAATCVATATDTYLVEIALARHDMRGLVGPIISCGDVGTSKDGPVVFETALRAIGTDKDRTLVFDDSLYALKAASAAGFLTAGIADPSSEPVRNDIISAVDVYFDDLGQACSLLGGHASGRTSS